MTGAPGPVGATQIADARRADILAWLPGLRQTGRTDGGEWHGPCPRCGGSNRFMAWPAHPRGPRARCRQCHPAALDAIALVQWLGQARTFGEAVALLAMRTMHDGRWTMDDGRRTVDDATGNRQQATRAGLVIPHSALRVPQAPTPYCPPWGGRQVIARYNYYRPNFYVETREDWHAPEEEVAARRAAHGEVPVLLYQKERWEPGLRGRTKDFICRHPRPDLGRPPRDDHPEDWLFGTGVPREVRWPYNWPAALALPPGAPLFWGDGEKDVETARRAGIPMVCGPDGGGTWRAEWSPLFYERDAYLIADGTPEGLAQARKTARLLRPFPTRISILRLPDKDLTAWFEAGLAPITIKGVTHAV